MSNFATAIRTELLKSQMTHAEFARKLGITVNTLSSWMHEITQPRLDNLQRVARTLGLDPRDLVG